MKCMWSFIDVAAHGVCVTVSRRRHFRCSAVYCCVYKVGARRYGLAKLYKSSMKKNFVFWQNIFLTRSDRLPASNALSHINVNMQITHTTNTSALTPKAALIPARLCADGNMSICAVLLSFCGCAHARRYRLQRK